MSATTDWEDMQARGVAVLDPSSWTDDGDAYTVRGVSRPTPTQPPTITDMTPDSLPASDPPTTVRIIGTDFVHGDRVSFGGATPPTSFLSDSELEVPVNPADWSRGEIDVQIAYTSRGPSNTMRFDFT